MIVIRPSAIILLTFHLQSEHKLQITSAVLHNVVHVTRALAVPPHIVFRSDPGGLFVREIATSLFWIQLFRTVGIVYSIAPYVHVAKAPRHHYHIRPQRSASGIAHHQLFNNYTLKLRLSRHGTYFNIRQGGPGILTILFGLARYKKMFPSNCQIIATISVQVTSVKEILSKMSRILFCTS